jgi:predicted Zn-dependent protease
MAGCGTSADRAADYLTKAQRFYDAGDYVSARVEAKNAAQIEPKNARARYLLALVAERDDDIRQMFGHLMVAVDSDPKFVDARLKLGNLYFIGQMWDKADQQLGALQQLVPNDSRVRLLRARLLIRKGDRNDGLAEIDRVLEAEPNNVDGILLKAAAAATADLDQGLAILDAAIARLERDKSRQARQLRLKDRPKGREILEKAIARLETDKTRQLRELRVMLLAEGNRLPELEQGLRSLVEEFPENRQYQYELAQFYSDEGRVDEADALLRSLAESDKAQLDDRLVYVQFLARERDASQAEATLKRFIKESPNVSTLKLALGQLYLENQRPEDARAVFREVAKLDPKSADGLAARNRLAALEIRVGRVTAALAVMESILADAPDNPTALLLRAGAKYVDKNYGAAVADLRMVLRKDVENERALLLMALAHLQLNEPALAKDAYRRLLDFNPTSPEGLLQLAQLHASERNFAEAEILLRRRVKADAEDLVASGRLVEMLIKQGKTAAAQAEAQRMSSLKTHAGVGDYSLGRVLFSMGNFSAAADAFRRSSNTRNNDPVVLEALAEALEAAGNSNEAITLLSDRVRNQNNPLLARFLLGGIFARQGDTTKAAEYFESVIREKPSLSYTYISLAGVYKQDPQARIKALQRGLDAIPGDPAISMILGAELDRAQQFDRAIRVYEELVKKQPDFEPGLNNLAALLLDHRTADPQSQVRALSLAKKLANSSNPMVLDTVGWAYYRNKQYHQAVRILEQVVGKAGDHNLFRYHLAMAYLGVGNTEAAKRQLEISLRRVDNFPGRQDAEALLSRIGAAPTPKVGLELPRGTT